MTHTNKNRAPKLRCWAAAALCLLIFAAGCGSSIDATSTLQPTPTEEPTATIQPTPTEEPTPTIEPTEAPFSFNLPEATLDNVEIPEIAKNQFPLEKKTFSDGLPYREFSCVTDDIKVDWYEIAPGVTVMASAECWYEQDGKQYSVRIPLVYEVDNQNIIYGYGATDWWEETEEDGSIWNERAWLENAPREHQENYWNAWLERIGFRGIGHIFNVWIIEPDPNNLVGNFSGFGNEQLQTVYTQEILDQFSENGDPSIVGGILYSPEPGMFNRFNR